MKSQGTNKSKHILQFRHPSLHWRCTLLLSAKMSEASLDTPKPSKRKWDQPAPGEDASAPAKVAKVEESKSASEAAAAAAAIAAKIAAQFANGTLGGDGSKDQHDAKFTQDIDINDVRNRYLLTRGSTQDQVRALTPCVRMVVGYSCTLAFRFTMKLGHLWGRGVCGIQTDRRRQRKILLCTSTYRPKRRKCWTAPSRRLMS